MKDAPKVWDHIQSKTQDCGFGVTANAETPAVSDYNTPLDFQATRFDTRSRRLNTNMARTNPNGEPAAAAATGSAKASEKASEAKVPS